ncbi:MAG: MFS transporter [Eggerthellaceae bacterium]|nr:MFS transporter [Eggerthellaceae bacterium]
MIKRHYEKVIVGCCFAFLFVNVGFASTAFAVHQPFIVALDGIGDTGGSLILSVRTLVSLFAIVIVDRYFGLLDVRLGVLFASLMTAAGFIVYSFATSLPVFFAGAVLLGFGYSFGGLVAMTLLANRWYAENVGSAVGFATMGSGAASIVMPLLVVRVINASSLSTAFFMEGVLAAIIGVIVFLLLRNKPSDMGLEPYVGKPGKKGRRPRQDIRPASKGDHLLLMAAMVFVGAFCCGAITYMSVLATTSGFDPVFAATVVSIAGVALTVSKFVTGELFDAMGTRRGSAVVFVVGFVGFTLCCFAWIGSAALMVAAAVLVGAGISLGSVGISVWSLELSNEQNRAREIKNFQTAYSIGGFIANTFPGILKDLVGTYVVSYAGMLVLLVLAGVIVLRHYRKYSA